MAFSNNKKNLLNKSGKAYQIDTANGPVTLQNSRGTTYTDASRAHWDAVSATETQNGFQVLLQGQGTYEGKYYMWDTNEQGVITRGSGWKTTQQAVQLGWENTFGNDLDGDGLIDGGDAYQLASENGPVTLQNSRGATYTDASRAHWDAVAATETQNGFQVLLDGDATHEGKYYMWDTNEQGVITRGSGWKTTQQAVQLGWENTFGNDLDGDGLIDGGDAYQLASENGPVTLQNSRGATYTDASRAHWDAVAATETQNGFQVLLDGDATHEGKYYMWDTNEQGVITRGSGWKTTQQAVQLGWENTFGNDLDGDGLIDGGDAYQLASENGPVTLQNSRGATYTDASRAHWDAVAATETQNGFQVLLDGDATHEGKYYMWDTNEQGVITRGSGWKTTQQAVQLGWENTFGNDLDGDGLIDGGDAYQLASENGPVTLQNSRGTTYTDASRAHWDAVSATETQNGFQVLLDGDATHEGKYYMWDTNEQGVITRGSGWKTTQQAVQLGWEHTFGRDLNLDGFIGSRIFDASGDASKKEVFEDGALEISYCKNYLSNLKDTHSPTFNFLGTEIKLPGWVSAGVTATKNSTGETVDLGSTILDLSKNSFYVNLKDKLDASEGWFDLRSQWSIDVDIDAKYTNGTSINLDDFSEGITMIDALDSGSAYKGDLTAETFSYTDFGTQLGSGRIYQGRGGTDTLELNGINKADILKFNGSALDDLGNSAAGGAALGQQAFYGGTVFDVLSLNNGDEIYLQGIEKISCEDGDIQVHGSMSQSTKEQWNLQAMDVSGAWRFNRGSSDVKLVSLDSGIGDIDGNPSDIDNEIGHVINRSAKNTYTDATWAQKSARDHGHRAMSVMSAKHDGQNLAGIAPKASSGPTTFIKMATVSMIQSMKLRGCVRLAKN